MWQKIKAMKEERGAILAEMKGIINTAEQRPAEQRELTAEESASFDALNVKAEAKLAEIRRYEAIDAAERSDASRALRPGHENINVDWTGDHDTNEVRALRKDESCADYLRSRGFATDPLCSFGALMRATVTGPRNAAEKRALSEGTDSAGGVSVAPSLFAEVIDKLRPESATWRAGARVVPLASMKSSFVKIAADPAATWRAENASVNVADATFTKVEFQPKTLAVIVKASRELLEDSLNAAQAIEMCFARAFASELDRVALLGSSGAGEPVGLANFTGINSVSMGTDGAALTSYAKVLDAIYEVELDNAAVNAVIAHPRTMRTLNGLVDSTGQPMRKPDSLSGVPFLSTTAVPINDTQGSASNASKLFVGDFTRLWFGIRTELQIQLLNQTYAGNLQHAWLAYLRADVQASHENAFTKLIGIVP